MKFETARVCVLKRSFREPQPENEPPIYDFEVVAWPPGEVEGGLLPHNGDILTLPGFETPFRVIDRALHWPPPTSPEAARGEIRVDLIVEEAETQVKSPFGRPGAEQIRAEGRWLEARVASYEARTSFGGTDYVRVDFAIDGVGTLSRQIMRNWQALEMFPGWADFQNRPSHEAAQQSDLTACLRIGQEFEVRVAPSELPSQNGRLEIWEVRPPRQLELGEEPNTWAAEANEVTDNLWGEI